MRLPVAAFAGNLSSGHAGQVVFVELVEGLRASVTGNAIGLPAHHAHVGLRLMEEVTA